MQVGSNRCLSGKRVMRQDVRSLKQQEEKTWSASGNVRVVSALVHFFCSDFFPTHPFTAKSMLFTHTHSVVLFIALLHRHWHDNCCMQHMSHVSDSPNFLFLRSSSCVLPCLLPLHRPEIVFFFKTVYISIGLRDLGQNIQTALNSIT